MLTSPDGRIIRANETFSRWVGYRSEHLTGRQFPDLLAAGSRIHYETHFVSMLHMNGSLDGVAADLLTADGTRLAGFVTANVERDAAGRWWRCGSRSRMPANAVRMNANSSRPGAAPTVNGSVRRCSPRPCSGPSSRRRCRRRAG
ncbi:PAS domain-containing protein [Mycolicibacterium gilvum]|uniref:PAS domain-containing protein n=1 Tax=Mycolicibacterium gilvum TaxID=1804 RepID=UPI003077D43E